VRRPFAAALALAAIAAATTGGPAQAQLRGSYEDPTRERLAGLGTGWIPQVGQIKGTKGYKVRVAGTGPLVVITAMRKPGSVLYSTKGKATRKRIRARFGKLGRVDLRFRKKGKMRTRKPPRGCVGRGDKVQPGVWRGIVRFKGERGYTRVRKRRVRGRWVRRGDYTCPERARAPEPDSTVHLQASAMQTGANVFFSVRRLVDPGDRPRFLATSEERIRRVGILRTVELRGQPDHFTFSLDALTATVQPPRPFSGTATYDGTTETWSGDLEVAFPGRRAALTGPGFFVLMDVLEP
jgi:hypothetical protein